MEEAQIAETQSEGRKQDLYTRHVEGFVKAAEDNLDQALERYGFTVWHSLPPKEAAILKERLGVSPLEAPDLYNRGTGYALEGKWAEAKADLRAAMEKDPDYAPAAFNLALCLEKTERFDQAREAYESYLEILDRARDRRDLALGSEVEIARETARIRQHLETLGKS
ncbi:hypothetical protein AMJ85_05950 [candidate division BRC1 bacterium SM23_51]|nr:MAG: hypothetical protein AMJ85_05950 [candidate division BRC1 bacterium SM23_51]